MASTRSRIACRGAADCTALSSSGIYGPRRCRKKLLRVVEFPRIGAIVSASVDTAEANLELLSLISDFLQEFVQPVARRQACECDRPFGRDRNLQIWGQRQTEVGEYRHRGCVGELSITQFFCSKASDGWRLPLRLSISARGGRLDDDRLAGIDDGGVGALKLLDPAAFAPHGILADLTGLAPGEAERAHAAVA